MKNMENDFEEVGNKWNKRNYAVTRGQNEVKKDFFSTFITGKFKTLKDFVQKRK